LRSEREELVELITTAGNGSLMRGWRRSARAMGMGMDEIYRAIMDITQIWWFNDV
jgi:hypothetical protein